MFNIDFLVFKNFSKVNYLYMLLCFWVIILCTLGFVVYNLFKVYGGKAYKVFYDKHYNNFNYSKILCDIIDKKISALPQVEFFINKDAFTSLKLNFAPVYVVDKNKLGQSHLKIYQSALEKLKQPINFVILNGKIVVSNPKVNVVTLNKNDITKQQQSLLNILNCNIYADKNIFNQCKVTTTSHNNKNTLSNQQSYYNISSSNFCENEILVCEQLSKNLFVAKVKKGVEYRMSLPKAFYNHLQKGQKNNVSIFNVFGEKIVEIKGMFSCECIDHALQIRPSKDCLLNIIPHFSDRATKVLSLLNFCITTNKYNQEIQLLRDKAIKQMSNNIFECENMVEGFSVENIKTFFKVANLRKSYFNDYIFLLQEVFGIKLNQNVLLVNPNHLIDFDFDINYTLNGTDYVVKYSHINGEKVKLNYAGHKLGHQDDYVFGF